MVTIKIEIGFGKEQKSRHTEFDIKKAAWIAALADSIIWLVFGAISLSLFYGTMQNAYALPFMAGALFVYLLYFIIKARFLTGKYGRSVYQKEFGNTGLFLVLFSIVLYFFLQ